MEPLPSHASDLVEPVRGEGLCDACLGRAVARLGYGLTNVDRGRSLRDAPGPAPSDCPLCEGLSGRHDRVAELALRAADGIDHGTFALGCRVDDRIEEREDRLWERHDLAETAEPLRTQMTREAGKVYEPKVTATFEPERPDLTLIVDTRFWGVETEIRSVYVYGRYRKLVRTIPQTRWDCRSCRGHGCAECDGTGKRYPTSVEEEIAGAAVDAFAAQEAVLHGQGREDVDARMLGEGRPFVLEVKRPFRRSTDLATLADAVADGSEGRVEVRDLRFVDGDAVASVKNARSEKTYRVEIRLADPIEGEKLKKATSALEGTTVSQRTPARVAHRRADRVRERRVHRADVEDAGSSEATIVVRGDAGLYVKELVSGDDGRTEPSLSGLLGTQAEVTALDVLAVEGPHGETIER